MFRDWVNFFRMSKSEGLAVQFLGTAHVDGNEAQIISVTDSNDNTVKLFLNAKTFMPLKKTYRGMAVAGPSDLEERYSDFRDISGIKLPFTFIINTDGKKFVERKIVEAKFNTEIKPSIFQKQ
jgi:hypothetical protein